MLALLVNEPICLFETLVLPWKVGAQKEGCSFEKDRRLGRQAGKRASGQVSRRAGAVEVVVAAEICYWEFLPLPQT